MSAIHPVLLVSISTVSIDNKGNSGASTGKSVWVTAVPRRHRRRKGGGAARSDRNTVTDTAGLCARSSVVRHGCWRRIYNSRPFHQHRSTTQADSSMHAADNS